MINDLNIFANCSKNLQGKLVCQVPDALLSNQYILKAEDEMHMMGLDDLQNLRLKKNGQKKNKKRQARLQNLSL